MQFEPLIIQIDGGGGGGGYKFVLKSFAEKQYQKVFMNQIFSNQLTLLTFGNDYYSASVGMVVSQINHQIV